MVDENVTLNELPKKAQEMSNWCWVTCAQSVLDYHNIPLEQCNIVDWACDHEGVKNLGVCSKKGNFNFSETGSGVPGVLLNWGIPGSAHSKPATMSDIMSGIGSGNPFIRAISWNGGAHVTIVRGYARKTVNGVDLEFVHIMDPGGGQYSTLAYQTAIDDGTIKWGITLETEFINQNYGQGCISFRDHSLQRIYAFLCKSNGHLHVNYWDGSKWLWADQGIPQGTTKSLSDPVVITCLDHGIQRIYAFARGDNNHLYVNYWDGSIWKWSDQGTPVGAVLDSRPNTIVYKEDQPDVYQGNLPRIYTFVIGNDHHLHVNYWDGSKWIWKDQGTPSGISLSNNTPSVITQMKALKRLIYVFVVGSNGNLYVNWWDGLKWNWANQGIPPGASSVSDVHIITFKDKDIIKIYAFVKGIDGNLHVNYWDGSIWHWANQGKPAGTDVSIPLGVITYRENDRQRIYAFVRGNNGHLHVNYWDGLKWHWADQGVPPTTQVDVCNNPGVLTYREGNTQKIYAFVKGVNQHLYVNYWNGSVWKWADQAHL
jgi:hypothetical protein